MITGAMNSYLTDILKNKVNKASYRIGGSDFTVNIESKAVKPKRVDFSFKIKANDRPGETCEKVSLLDADGVELFSRAVSIERNADYGDTLYIYTITLDNIEG